MKKIILKLIWNYYKLTELVFLLVYNIILLNANILIICCTLAYFKQFESAVRFQIRSYFGTIDSLE